MKRNLLTAAIVAAVLLSLGASYDRRDLSRFPVARVECTQVSWDTGDGHTAQTTTAAINGVIYRIDIIVGNITGNNPTINVSFADDNGVVCLPAMNGLALNSKNFKNALVNSIAASADFDPVAVAGTITVTVDPSADPGGTAQTLTVDVIFYIR